MTSHNRSTVCSSAGPPSTVATRAAVCSRDRRAQLDEVGIAVAPEGSHRIRRRFPTSHGEDDGRGATDGELLNEHRTRIVEQVRVVDRDECRLRPSRDRVDRSAEDLDEPTVADARRQERVTGPNGIEVEDDVAAHHSIRKSSRTRSHTSAARRDLPTPEAPKITTGRRSADVIHSTARRELVRTLHQRPVGPPSRLHAPSR